MHATIIAILTFYWLFSMIKNTYFCDQFLLDDSKAEFFYSKQNFEIKNVYLL